LKGDAFGQDFPQGGANALRCLRVRRLPDVPADELFGADAALGIEDPGIFQIAVEIGHDDGRVLEHEPEPLVACGQLGRSRPDEGLELLAMALALVIDLHDNTIGRDEDDPISRQAGAMPDPPVRRPDAGKPEQQARDPEEHRMAGENQILVLGPARVPSEEEHGRRQESQTAQGVYGLDRKAVFIADPGGGEPSGPDPDDRRYGQRQTGGDERKRLFSAGNEDGHGEPDQSKEYPAQERRQMP
jgi:hypothetical protein